MGLLQADQIPIYPIDRRSSPFPKPWHQPWRKFRDVLGVELHGALAGSRMDWPPEPGGTASRG